MDWQRRLVFTMLDVMARYSVNLNLICKAEFRKSLDFQEWWLEMCSKILLNILWKCTNEGENCNISQIPCKILILQKAIHFVVHITTTKSWNRLGVCETRTEKEDGSERHCGCSAALLDAVLYCMKFMFLCWCAVLNILRLLIIFSVN